MQMEIYMMVSGVMIRHRGMEFIYTWMELGMKETGWKISSMVMV